jgi:hypothetical protein
MLEVLEVVDIANRLRKLCNMMGGKVDKEKKSVKPSAYQLAVVFSSHWRLSDGRHLPHNTADSIQSKTISKPASIVIGSMMNLYNFDKALDLIVRREVKSIHAGDRMLPLMKDTRVGPVKPAGVCKVIEQRSYKPHLCHIDLTRPFATHPTTCY